MTENTLCGRPLKFGDKGQIQELKRLEAEERAMKAPAEYVEIEEIYNAKCPHCHYEETGYSRNDAFENMTREKNKVRICASCKKKLLI